MATSHNIICSYSLLCSLPLLSKVYFSPRRRCSRIVYFAGGWLFCFLEYHSVSSSIFKYPHVSSSILMYPHVSTDIWFSGSGSMSHPYTLCLGYVLFSKKYTYEFPLAPMGVLAPGSAHARPSARPPIDTSGNFPAHMSAESPWNISPNP